MPQVRGRSYGPSTGLRAWLANKRARPLSLTLCSYWYRRRNSNPHASKAADLESAALMHHTPTGFAFSGSILYSLIARATSLPVILPSFASASIAAWAM